MRHDEQDALAGGIFKRFGPEQKQFDSSDLDELRFVLRREVGPSKFDIRGRNIPFSTTIQFRKLNDLRLSYTWFAPAMVISSIPAEPYYSLYFRHSGSSEYRLPGRTFVTSPSCGAFWPGLHPVQVRTKENWHVFGTRFSSSAIQLELSHMLGRDIVRPVDFDPMVDFDYGAGRIVKRLLMQLYEKAGQHESELAKSGLGMRQIELSLITLVLDGLRHNYSKFVNGPARNIAPWQVRAVEEFIFANAGQPISLGNLAVIGGVSARSLQFTFRRHRGCSPMEFLRRIRLERIRDELLHPTHDTTVTSAAMRWGFLHLGRFAGEYRARFNESPSATLHGAARPNDWQS
jgi:AraC-like DNA-binding protein